MLRSRHVVLACALAAAGGLGLISCTRSDAPRPPASQVEASGTKTAALQLSNGAGHLPPRVPIASCKAKSAPSAAKGAPGDPKARLGAQRGLGFVAQNALDWQQGHNCYGCHVQAVTLEALTVGRKNQYDVPQAQLDKILHGMLDLSGGAHGSSGLSYENASLFEPSKAFGGAAFAHYDEAIDGRVRKELLATAKELMNLQLPDGHVGDYGNGLVAVGPIQTTTQALQTWRQAYERTADERWQVPMRRAEAFIQSEAKRMTDAKGTATLHVDYAIIGLVSAGASRSEAVVRSLARQLLATEEEDGGWGTSKGQPSSALVTGATLYALRLTGMNDQDPAIAKGTRWLLGHQGEDGGWSHGGTSRAEAMWAVLGLVTLDMMTVDVAGLEDGAHVQGVPAIQASARDNAGGAVERLDLAVDDVTLKSVCGSALDFALDSAWLGDGAHTVDVIATNASGHTSRRRVSLYAGAYYLTEVGTSFEDNGTMIALRDLAPRELASKVELHVFATRDDKGERARGDEVYQATQSGEQGPMRFFWNGQDAKGKAQPGSYVAELRFVAGGAVVQKVETPFVHDTREVQQQKYGEVEGQLQGDGPGQAALANTEVDLVDAKGNVVQKVKTTAQGNYRFRNVDQGDYQVRVRRDGFDAAETKVSAKPAAVAPAPVQMHAQ